MHSKHSHPIIIAAPAPPPAYVTVGRPNCVPANPLHAHLTNFGNRVFHLAPTTRLLESGNFGACIRNELEPDSPTLLAVLPPRLWRPLLRLFMRLRDKAVGGPIRRRLGRGRTAERDWARRCVATVPALAAEAAKEDGCVEDGGWIEVWAAVAVTNSQRLVADLIPGIPGQNVELVSNRYLWASRTLVIPSHFNWNFINYIVEPRDDFFEGRWTEAYFNKLEGGMHGETTTGLEGRVRRSYDSGELEVQAEEEDDD